MTFRADDLAGLTPIHNIHAPERDTHELRMAPLKTEIASSRGISDAPSVTSCTVIKTCSTLLEAPCVRILAAHVHVAMAQGHKF